MRELALFAGAGGGILGGHLLGWRTVCAVEIDAYCATVLSQRQNDGLLSPFPIWSDVRTFDGRPWRGVVDVVSAGFPCQPFSAAGKQLGADDPRNMWPDTARIIREVRPRYAFLENVPDLITNGYLYAVAADLAAMGFDAEWGVIRASSSGAPHERERLWVLASDANAKLERRRGNNKQQEQSADVWRVDNSVSSDRVGGWLAMARKFRGMDDGLACAVERTAAIGNGQVPAVVRLAWRMLI